jgi:hypothetical protein
MPTKTTSSGLGAILVLVAAGLLITNLPTASPTPNGARPTPEATASGGNNLLTLESWWEPAGADTLITYRIGDPNAGGISPPVYKSHALEDYHRTVIYPYDGHTKVALTVVTAPGAPRRTLRCKMTLNGRKVSERTSNIDPPAAICVYPESKQRKTP